MMLDTAHKAMHATVVHMQNFVTQKMPALSTKATMRRVKPDAAARQGPADQA